MKIIKPNHYKDTVVFQIEEAISKFKSFAVKYFNNLNIGITSEQFVLLDTIYCNPGISQKKLSITTMKNMSNITRIINILEESQLIYKEIGKNKNYIIKQLYITEKGKQLIDNNIEKIKEIFNSVFCDFTEDEIKTFRDLALKFENNFKDLS